MATIGISQQDETITVDTADDITIDIGGQPDVTVDISVTDTASITVEAIGLPGIPGPPGGVTDHGNLTGLLDDDHPQYKQYIDAKLAGKITVASTSPGSPAINDIWVDTT